MINSNIINYANQEPNQELNAHSQHTSNLQDNFMDSEIVMLQNKCARLDQLDSQGNNFSNPAEREELVQKCRTTVSIFMNP